jgi:hypothetical protein
MIYSNADAGSLDRRQPGSNVMFLSLPQSWKHPSQTFLTEAGMQIDSSDLQSSKAQRVRTWTLHPGSKTTLERRLHSQKHRREIFSTDEGIQIDSSDEHHSNAYAPKLESAEPGSIVTRTSLRHPPKHSRLIFCTKAGMQIHSSDDSQNSDFPRTETVPPASKATPLRFLQHPKAPSAIAGMSFPIVTSLTSSKNRISV